MENRSLYLKAAAKLLRQQAEAEGQGMEHEDENKEVAAWLVSGEADAARQLVSLAKREIALDKRGWLVFTGEGFIRRRSGDYQDQMLSAPDAVRCFHVSLKSSGTYNYGSDERLLRVLEINLKELSEYVLSN